MLAADRATCASTLLNTIIKGLGFSVLGVLCLVETGAAHTPKEAYSLTVGSLRFPSAALYKEDLLLQSQDPGGPIGVNALGLRVRLQTPQDCLFEWVFCLKKLK